jgi:hypothetical protein
MIASRSSHGIYSFRYRNVQQISHLSACPENPSHLWIPESKKRFTFSADELDRVKIKEPMPEYLKRRYSRWGLKYLLLCMIAIWIGAVVLGYLFPK